jgi:Tfp pilus assembly protein PilN
MSVEQVVEGIYGSRTLLSGVLRDISYVIPENVWFTDLGVTVLDPGVESPESGPAAATDNRIQIQGKTYSFEDVSRLLVRLKLVPSLTDIELVSAKEEEVDSLKLKGFVIDATVINTQLPGIPLPPTEVEVAQ